MFKTRSAAAHHGLERPLDHPFCLMLSFVDLKVLVLVENGDTTFRGLKDSLGMGPRETTALFRELVQRGLLHWAGRISAPGVLPLL